MAIVTVSIFLLGLAAGYGYTLHLADKEAEKYLTRVQAREVIKEEAKIDANTKMIYQYFYTEDKATKEQIEPAPDFLQGLDMEQLQSVYTGWQLVYFSPEKVTLRCKIEGKSSESYIIGEDSGYLAVFYEDAQKTIRLRERTEIPLSVLPEGEILQIQEGLRVTGEENLARVLADYRS